MRTLYVFYQVCLIVFIAQGVGLPSLVVVSFVVYIRQEKRLTALKRMAGSSHGGEIGKGSGRGSRRSRRSRRAGSSILEKLPKFQPLKCVNCGGGMLLEKASIQCPNCQTKAALPDDYAMAVSLRERVRKLTRRAILQWRAARILTSRPLSKLFFLLIFIEPLVIFLGIMIGSVEFPNTWFDKLFADRGSHWQILAYTIIGLGFVGVFVGMFLFIFLAGWGSTVRDALPVVPVLGKERHVTETASCQSCGGCIQYDSSDFATICGYCHVENYRVEFTRWARKKGEAEKSNATFTLFEALNVVNDFFGTLWLVGGIIYIAFILLVLVSGVKHWISG